MVKNRITVNNVTFEVEGESVSVCNGTLYVGGVSVASGLSGTVHIVWQGDLASLEADGSVTCQNIYGDVVAGHSVHCKSAPGRFANRQPNSAAGINGNITAGHSIQIC